VTSAVISAAVRDRIRDLRERAGLGRDELAERAREHGATEMTANVVGFLERGRRGLTLEELLTLAQALEVSPLELLGDQAEVFVGPAGPCPRCASRSDEEDADELVATIRADVVGLGELAPLEASLTALAIQAASDADQLPVGDKERRLNRADARAALGQIAAGRQRAQPDVVEEDDLDDLDAPD
jgi:transcriptional regulator with XRE-family HTH domain